MGKENTRAFVLKVGKREKENGKSSLLARPSREDARLASHSQQNNKKNVYTKVTSFTFAVLSWV